MGWTPGQYRIFAAAFALWIAFQGDWRLALAAVPMALGWPLGGLLVMGVRAWTDGWDSAALLAGWIALGSRWWTPVGAAMIAIYGFLRPDGWASPAWAIALAIGPAWIPPRRAPAGGLTVLFDGDCALCNRWVRFVGREDRRGCFAYEPGPPTETSVGLLDRAADREWRESDAVLRILEHLGGLWRIGAMAARIVPKRWRDRIYRLVARHRRKWPSGDVCEIPAQPLNLSRQAAEQKK